LLSPAAMPRCGAPRSIKDKRSRRILSLFGAMNISASGSSHAVALEPPPRRRRVLAHSARVRRRFCNQCLQVFCCFFRHSSRESPKYAMFDTRIDQKTGCYLSEDYAFCELCREVGEHVWADLKSRLNHVGFSTFTGDVGAKPGRVGVERQGA
jgi:hypothetical protein